MEVRMLDPGSPIPGLGGRTVGHFWSWAYSDAMNNRNRSILAEYIVGAALDAIDAPRMEWDKAPGVIKAADAETGDAAK